VGLRSTIATILLLAATGGAVAAATPPAQEPFAEAVVELRINDQPESTTLVVRRDKDGTLLVRAADLAALRLRTPARGAVLINGERHYRLGREIGALVVFDEGTQSGQVTLPPDAFLPTRRERRAADAPRPERAALGGFVNYDVSLEQDDHGRQGGGFFELGLFGGPGVVTGTLVARVEQGRRSVARLDTTWTRDFPDRLATLRVGDAISTPGAWGRAVRFGGVQFGTNFSTQPSLVTTPLLAARGEATVPSTVDVFVNQRHVASEQVPPGPFAIDRLPVLTGAGQLQVVVTDALGRQQVITQPYYSGTALLRPDLDEYAVELGRLREDYGTSSFGYGGLVGSATYRRGLSDTLTAGARAEAQADGAYAAGGDAAWQAGRLGILTAHGAASVDGATSGYLAGLGLEHNGRRFSAYAHAQYASPGFAQVGTADLEQTPRARAFAGLGWDFERYGNLQLAWGLQSYYDAATIETLGLSYSLTLGRLGYLGLFATHANALADETTVLLNWTLPLGDRRTLSTSLQQSSGAEALGGGVAAYATLQRDLPSDAGLGYRFAASTADDQDASVAWQGQAGTATLDYARRGDASGIRAGATGALALTGAGAIPARRLDQSFAVVQVADYEGLTVYLDNQPVGRTDAHGRVLVSPLRPYERNEVSVNPLEVPMDGAIDRPAIDVTPAYRSGAVVRFPVKRADAATLRLVQADGTPVPAGAQASLGTAVFPVALDGMLYVEGLREPTRVRVAWSGGECSVPVRRPPGTDPMPDLGTLRCR
jgi:outer membrane usher protein